jgi:hypothetical protein
MGKRNAAGMARMQIDEALALLGDPSLSDDSIADEMANAGEPRPAPEAVGAARKLLGDVAAVSETEPLLALPPVLRRAALRAFADGGREDLLHAAIARADKDLGKEAKRELHRLKQKGVPVQEARPVGEPVVRPFQESAGEAACHATSLDAYGERAVWFCRFALRGYDVVQAVLSDLKGLIAVQVMSVPRKAYRDFIRALPTEGPVTTVEIPASHARALIARAVERNAAAGTAVPPAYEDASPILGPAPSPLPDAPGRARFREDPARAGESAQLFDDPLFAMWIPEEAALRQLGLRIDEIATSQLYLDEAQKVSAQDRAVADAAEAYFTPERRASYAERLFEMAFILLQSGHAPGDQLAASAAHALERGDPASSIGFARRLFERAFRRPQATGASAPEAQPPGQERSLVVPG